jgi:hypothetical protein
MADRSGNRQCVIAEIKRNNDGPPTLEPWREGNPDGPLVVLLESPGHKNDD